MGIGAQIEDYETLFAQSRNKPIVVNDIPEATEEEKERLNRLIFTKYNSTDLLSNVPSCERGCVTGEFNIGVTCPTCGTEVTHPFGDLEPIIWIRAPNGVAKLMNPTIWGMLSTRFTKSGFNVIQWLTDSRYDPAVKYPDFMPLIEAMGFQRSYNYFVNNFDRIMDTLFSIKKLQTKAKEVTLLEGLMSRIPIIRNFVARESDDPYRLLLMKYRDRIFSKYIPVPNKLLLVVETNNIGTFMDLNLSEAINAVRTMVGIDSALSNYSTKVKENRSVKAISILSDFYDDFIKNTISPKEGIARKHVLGSRLHFSFRAVISSITEPHYYGEIQIPWAIGLTVFELHLTNKLLKLGWTPNGAKKLLYAHTDTYHPLLDQLLNELLDESQNAHMFPDGVHRRGVPCTLLRNPSLELGSNILMLITKVKTNLNDPTVSIPILVVKGLNADFDGDACNFCLTLDNYTASRLKTMLPHRTAFNLERHRGVSGNLGISKPVITLLANFMASQEV